MAKSIIEEIAEKRAKEIEKKDRISPEATRAKVFENNVVSNFSRVMEHYPVGISIPSQRKRGRPERIMVEKWEPTPSFGLFAKPYKSVEDNFVKIAVRNPHLSRDIVPLDKMVVYVIPKKISIGVWVRCRIERYLAEGDTAPLTMEELLRTLAALERRKEAPFKVFGIYSVTGWEAHVLDQPPTPSVPSLVYAIIHDRIVHTDPMFKTYMEMFPIVQVAPPMVQRSTYIPAPVSVPSAPPTPIQQVAQVSAPLSVSIPSPQPMRGIEQLVMDGTKEEWREYISRAIMSEQRIEMPPIDMEKAVRFREYGYRRFLELIIESEDFLRLITELGTYKDVRLIHYMRGDDALKRGLTMLVKLLRSSERTVKCRETETEWQYFEMVLGSLAEPRASETEMVWEIRTEGKGLIVKRHFDPKTRKMAYQITG
ncbi:MAG: hypothetical protein AB1665_07330 [Candidatus Thermoplasmatota archaeon]